MQIDAQACRRERRKALGEQRPDGAGQHIACAPGGERRVLERRDRDLAVRVGDHRTGALEDDDLLPCGRRVPGGGDPSVVVLDQVAVGGRVDAAARAQPSEFPGVRREHPRSPLARPPAVHRRERAERLRIEHDRRRLVAGRGDELANELGGGESRSQARTHHEGVVLVVEDAREGWFGINLFDVVLGEAHRRGLDHLGREQRLEGLGDRQRDEADAGPARRAAHQQRRARVVERAREHEQLAERALVAARAR